MSNKTIRIGTRDSQLATWQAEKVARELEKLGHDTELIFVKSEGDLDLTTPLTEMGGKGVFT
ncbi:MAG: hydroxymethylbilane synthase, partial [Aliifodinibius sp.]|nr:hydroxymethylbilane synthase [candidate division KSB1 bacterium]NIT56469.1 hydroxymethylbilane synthase [Fodinibius sp.]NIV11447.1 hydroxymethylbilane synthase [Fodinibius sp.]NIY25052.1 hydroxymethylbilane synthase [Fodinibius sp.]